MPSQNPNPSNRFTGSSSDGFGRAPRHSHLPKPLENNYILDVNAIHWTPCWHKIPMYPKPGKWPLLAALFLAAIPCLGATLQEIQLTSTDADESNIVIEGDLSGDIHVAYVRDGNVYYQCRHFEGPLLVPEEWVTWGENPCLAVDPAGNPQVVAVSSGTVHYAWRTNGMWASSAVGEATDAGFGIMEDGQAYIAYSHQIGDRSRITLARLHTNSWAVLSDLFVGYDATYACCTISPGEHHDFTEPSLACGGGVIHVAAAHTMSRDAGYTSQCYCAPRNDKRAAYCRYDFQSLQTSYSSWSSYEYLSMDRRWFCLSPDGVPHLLYLLGSGYNYCDSFLPWSAQLAPHPHMTALDAAWNNQVGLVDRDWNSGDIHLLLYTNGAFSAGPLLSTQSVGQLDLCLEYAVIAVIKTNESGSNDAYLWVNLDMDDDGIGDGWAQHHYGSLTNVYSDSRRDAYLCGTDPQDADSRFALEFVPSETNSLSSLLIRPGSLARIYSLLVTTNAGLSWDPFPDCSNLPGRGTPIAVSNPPLASGHAWFKASAQHAFP